MIQCCVVFIKLQTTLNINLTPNSLGKKRPFLSEMLHPPVNQCHIIPPIHCVKPKHAMLNHSVIKHLAF